MTALFYIVASLSVAGALAVVLSPNPLYGGLSLVGTFFLLGIIYILLSQEFIATVQVLVYAGAIMVLFLFVIMLFNLRKSMKGIEFNLKNIVAGLFAGGLIFQFVTLFTRMWNPSLVIHGPYSAKFVQVKGGTMKVIGELLFSKYLLPFEVTSLLLLIAVIGAVVLAKKNYMP